MQTFRPDPRLVLYEGYGEHLCLDSIIRAQVTTISCIVGCVGLTEHVTRLFLESPFARELAFLLPVHACAAETLLRYSGNVTIKRLAVRLARSAGTRTVVIAVKLPNARTPSETRNALCRCGKVEGAGRGRTSGHPSSRASGEAPLPWFGPKTSVRLI